MEVERPGHVKRAHHCAHHLRHIARFAETFGDFWRQTGGGAAEKTRKKTRQQGPAPHDPPTPLHEPLSSGPADTLRRCSLEIERTLTPAPGRVGGAGPAMSGFAGQGRFALEQAARRTRSTAIVRLTYCNCR